MKSNILDGIKFISGDTEGTQDSVKYVMRDNISRKSNVFAMGRVFLCKTSSGNNTILLVQKDGGNFRYHSRPINEGFGVAINREDYLLLKRHNYPLDNLRHIVLPRGYATAEPFNVSDELRILVALKNCNYQLIESTYRMQVSYDRLIKRRGYHSGVFHGEPTTETSLDDFQNRSEENAATFWVGCEIETTQNAEELWELSKRTLTTKGALKAGIPDFKCESDSSLPDNGYEFISRPLRNGRGLAKFITHFTNESPTGASSECGLHIHYSSNSLYFATVQQVRLFEHILLLKLNEAADGHRGELFGRDFGSYRRRSEYIDTSHSYSFIRVNSGHYELRIGKATNSADKNVAIAQNMLEFLRYADLMSQKLSAKISTDTSKTISKAIINNNQ